MSAHKKLEEMTHDELRDYIVGHLTLSIGSGNFASAVGLWIMNLQRIGYESGFKAGKKVRQ